MPRVRVGNPWADSGVHWQWAVHPTQMCLRDFHPALAHGWQAALLERHAMAIGIEPCVVAMAGVGHEQ